MAWRWKPWVPKSWISRLIRIMEWRPFNRIGGMILFEEYVEPKNYSFSISFPIDELQEKR